MKVPQTSLDCKLFDRGVVRGKYVFKIFFFLGFGDNNFIDINCEKINYAKNQKIKVGSETANPHYSPSPHNLNEKKLFLASSHCPNHGVSTFDSVSIFLEHEPKRSKISSYTLLICSQQEND